MIFFNNNNPAPSVNTRDGMTESAEKLDQAFNDLRRKVDYIYGVAQKVDACFKPSFKKDSNDSGDQGDDGYGKSGNGNPVSKSA